MALTEDLTGCTHVWERASITFLLPNVEDFECKNCHAHGQRDRSKTIIEYCHGGYLPKAALKAKE